MPNELPVFLFAFSNDAQGTLRLQEELADCRSALAGPAEKGQIAFVAAEYPTLEDIYDRFDRANDRIYFFHFSGHSDGKGLQLTDTHGKVESLATILGQQKRLKLVFLNGCANEEQVQVLWQKGVQTIIATSAKVSDLRARKLAARFYRSLAGGQTIRESFEAAVSFVSNDDELEVEWVHRGQGLETSGVFPWGLYVQDGHFLDWHLGRIEQVENLEALAELRDLSRARLAKFTSPGGRYRHLRIDEALLAGIAAAGADRRGALITSRIGSEAEDLCGALQQLWAAACPHAILTGAGGMGKTVSLIRLWQEMLEPEENPAPIPIFIPLHEFNNNPRSAFIRTYIQQHYDFTDFEQLAREPLQSEGTASRPHLILLLDGLNEVKGTLRELLLEINELRTRENFPGLQLVLTSRTDLRAAYQWHDFHQLALTPLQDEQITGFLNRPLPGDRRLLELLRNPMMLTLYAAQSELPERYFHRGLLREEISSKGDMLFNVEMIQRIKVEDQLAARPEEQARSRFVLEHLLPYIAWRMQREDLYFLAKKDERIPGLQSLLKEGLESLLTEAFFETFDFFCEHLDPAYFRQLLPKLFIQLMHRIAGDQLTILIRDGENYRFLHQDFRDYFAARYVQHQMDIALTDGGMPDVLQQAPLDFYLRQFLGELEREHTNRMEWQPAEKCWRWSHGQFRINNRLDRLLERCRGHFDPVQLGYTVWNILTIQKEKRTELSGADLRSLYLKNISFNRVRMARADIAADFAGALLEEDTLFSSGHTTRVKTAVFHPAGQQVLSAAYDGDFKIWDAQTGKCLHSVQASPQGLFSAAYSRDGKRIATTSFDGLVRVWDADSLTLIRVLGEQAPAGPSGSIGPGDSAWVVYASFNQRGDRLVSAHWDGSAKVWELGSGELIHHLQAGKENLNWATFSPQDDRIATVGRDGNIRIWDAGSGRLLEEIAEIFGMNSFKNGINSCVFSHDGQYLLCSGEDKTARIWDLEQKAVRLALEGHTGTVNSALFDKDSRRIITASGDSTLRIWEADSGFCQLTIPIQTFSCEFAAFSPDGKRIVATGYDGDVLILDALTGQSLVRMDDAKSGTRRAAFASGETGVHVVSYDDTVSKWDLESGRCVYMQTGFSGKVDQLLWDQDGKYLLAAAMQGTIRCLDPATDQLQFTLDGHQSRINDLCISRDGRLLLSASMDSTVRIWDLLSGKCLGILPHRRSVNSVRFSQDGEWIITAGDEIRIWEMNGKWETPKKSFPHQGTFSLKVAVFSPDNFRIAAAATFGPVQIWDVITEKVIASIEAHEGGNFGLAFSHDGKRLVTTSGDKTAKIWDLTTLECEQILEGHGHTVTDPAFSQDDQQIITSSGDGTVKIWDATSGNCLKTLAQIPGLMIQGCNFSDLHPGSDLSEGVISRLRQLGGILTEALGAGK